MKPKGVTTQMKALDESHSNGGVLIVSEQSPTCICNFMFNLHRKTIGSDRVKLYLVALAGITNPETQRMSLVCSVFIFFYFIIVRLDYLSCLTRFLKK